MKNNKVTVTWPEILVTGKIPQEYTTYPEWKMKQILCADGLMGWAICMSGATDKVPEMFGTGMTKIAAKLGTCTAEGLSKWADNNPIPEKSTT